MYWLVSLWVRAVSISTLTYQIKENAVVSHTVRYSFCEWLWTDFVCKSGWTDWPADWPTDWSNEMTHWLTERKNKMTDWRDMEADSAHVSSLHVSVSIMRSAGAEVAPTWRFISTAMRRRTDKQCNSQVFASVIVWANAPSQAWCSLAEEGWALAFPALARFPIHLVRLQCHLLKTQNCRCKFYSSLVDNKKRDWCCRSTHFYVCVKPNQVCSAAVLEVMNEQIIPEVYW